MRKFNTTDKIVTFFLAILLAGTVSIYQPAYAQSAAGPLNDAELQQQAESSSPETIDSLLDQLAACTDPLNAASLEKRIWKHWIDTDSDTVDLLMQRAISSMQDQNYPLALDLLNAIVGIKPDYAEGWNKRATVLFIMQEYSHSLRDVERVLELEPRHFGAISGLGLIMKQLGSKDKALAAFRKALEIHPHLVSAQEAVIELREDVEGRGI